MSVCACVCLCVYVSMCVYMSVCVGMITPVNTEEGEAPIPSRRARGRQQPQVAQDTVSTLGSLLSPSAAPAILQHPGDLLCVQCWWECCSCSHGDNTPGISWGGGGCKGSCEGGPVSPYRLLPTGSEQARLLTFEALRDAVDSQG